VQADEMGQPDQPRLADAASADKAAPSALGLEEATWSPVAQPGGPAPPESTAPQPSVPAQTWPATAASPSSAAGTTRQHVLPTRSPGGESSAAAGASGQSDEPATRSVWDPIGTKPSKASAEPASAETIQYAGPSIKTGPSAWQTWASRQATSLQQDDGAAGSAEAPAAAATAAGAQAVRDPKANDGTPTGRGHPEASSPRAESASAPESQASESQASFGAAPPRRQSQQGTDGLPKRQPMAHLAAPLRRDLPSAGPQQQASGGPLPSVWDTWRPTAAAKRTGQQDGSDTGDDQT
jgi:hypothetical protein